MDFVSVAAYFELTGNETNTADNLVRALRQTQIQGRKQHVCEELKNFHTVWGKPVFLGELGFPRMNRASVHPWNPEVSTVENGREQANCFAAYRTVFANEPWMLGFSVFAIGDHSPANKYYPGDESGQVIRQW